MRTMQIVTQQRIGLERQMRLHLLSLQPFVSYPVFKAQGLRRNAVHCCLQVAVRDETSSHDGASLEQMIWSGDDGGGVPRVPIPNTTVKPSSANGYLDRRVPGE